MSKDAKDLLEASFFKNADSLKSSKSLEEQKVDQEIINESVKIYADKMEGYL